MVEIKGMTWEAHLKDGSRATVDRNDFSFMEGDKRIRPDFAYITIHGTPGENGILQGYFDLIHLPYSTSDVLVEAMTFNKFTLNQYLKGFGVSVSESLIIRKGFEHQVTDAEIIDRIGLPCFVKPNAGGSSFGVTKVKEAAALHDAIMKAMNESDEVMVEAYMAGTEITCGCYKTKEKEVVFPHHRGGDTQRVFRLQRQIQRASAGNHPGPAERRHGGARAPHHLHHLRHTGMQRHHPHRLHHHTPDNRGGR